MTAPKSTNEQKAEETFEITREFNAPRDRVFQAWTDIKAFEKWWGPKGWDVKVKKLDDCPGDTFLYSMAVNNDVMWGRLSFREIEEPGRLIFVDSFSNADGTITRAPFSETWPLETVSIITLDEHNGKTRLKLQNYPQNATDEERRTFKETHNSMTEGWGGTLDQLADYLSTAKHP